MLTAKVIAQATEVWVHSSVTMSRRCNVVAEALAVKDLSELDTAKLLLAYTRMEQAGLKRTSIRTYVAAFKRACVIAGIDVNGWPPTPTPPRVKAREPISGQDILRMSEWFRERHCGATDQLMRLLIATGMRVQRELLARSFTVGFPAHTVTITGKGGHERTVPINRKTADILTNPEARVFHTSYRSHADLWKRCTADLQITSKLPTPHAARHKFATDALARCQNLELVRQMMGHADIATTALYVGVDLDQMRTALGIKDAGLLDTADYEDEDEELDDDAAPRGCGSRGFERSVLGIDRCTFCDGTEGGNPPIRGVDYAD